MKKLLSILLSTIMLLSAIIIVPTASAKEIRSGDYSYKFLDDGTISITRYYGKDKDLKLPEEIDGKKVTKFETVEKEIKKDLPTRSHARRQMLKVLYPVVSVPTEAAGRKKNTKEVVLVAKLFDEYAPKYAERKGGYTRIVKIGQRKGDAALEVVLELV